MLNESHPLIFKRIDHQNVTIVSGDLPLNSIRQKTSEDYLSAEFYVSSFNKSVLRPWTCRVRV